MNLTLHSPFGLYLRDHDKWGTGAFGASRDGGTRQHLGLDLAVLPGTPVYAPVVGTFTRIAQAYADDPLYKGVEIQLPDPSVKIKMLYVAPIAAKVGRLVTLEDCIGTVQDLRLKYPGITPHIHLEVWVGKDRVDPAPYLGISVPSLAPQSQVT